MKKGFFVLTVLSMLLTACAPVQVIEPIITDTSTVTVTPKPTPTQTLTSTFTATPTVTSTPTPAVTATPVGYYYNDQFAFSIILRGSWSMKESSAGVEFQNPTFDMAIFASSMDASGGSVDDLLTSYVTVFRSQASKIFASSSPGKKDSVKLGDGTQAVRQKITGTNSVGRVVGMEVTCAASGQQLYVFVIYGDSLTFQYDFNFIQEIYESIHLGGGLSGPTV